LLYVGYRTALMDRMETSTSIKLSKILWETAPHAMKYRICLWR
jgi:hypothetical protein